MGFFLVQLESNFFQFAFYGFKPVFQILIVWIASSLAFQQASSCLFCGVSGTFLCPTFTAISYIPNSASVGAEIDDAPMNTSGENLDALDA